MNLGTASVIRANSRNLPLADNSVDLICTSPPYFALRSYQDGGEHYAGQIGDEPTPAEFVASLLEVTRECVRVLKPSGSLWVNLGDKYAQSEERSRNGNGNRVNSENMRAPVMGPTISLGRKYNGGVPRKSLIGIPWRYALACIDDLGLILRAEVIWSKPNGLPESVTDRVRRSHEQWFCFEQSGGVEAAAQAFPFCPLCGRPVDARTTLVARLKELHRSGEAVGMSDEMGLDDGVDGEHAAGGDHDVAVRSDGTPVPMLEALDAELGVDAAHFVEDSVVAVVDADAEQRAALSPDERDRALPVDDAGEPADVCECVGHPLIIDDEPWIPQSLAAEIMQSVADGECDPQHAADFLSGDYARNHSVWFHFTLEPRYFSAVDEIREAHNSVAWIGRDKQERSNSDRNDGGKMANTANPLGKLPGSVWTIPTEPLRVPDHLGIDHFAAFPTEWPKRIIQGWSPAGVCVECGEGRRPVADVGELVASRAGSRLLGGDAGDKYAARDDGGAYVRMEGGQGFAKRERILTGYACACPEPTADTTPAVVLDCFGGTGTTAMVAKALGRHGISVDMSADYCRIAEWRTNDRNQLAKVLGVAKVDAPDDGQLDLFDGGAA